MDFRCSVVSDNKNQTNTIYSIQILRALAALLVVADHCFIHIFTVYNIQQPYHAMAWKLGGIGVMSFFVISGFVMALTNDKKFSETGGSLRFMVNRIIRIVPLYWVMTFIAAGLFIATASKEISVLYMLKSMYFIVPVDPSSGDIIQPVLGPGWTLNYEMFFYLIFAVFLALPKRAALNGFTTIMLALVIWGMTTLPSSEINDPKTLFGFYANPLLLLFVAGVWLGVLYRKLALFQTANLNLLWMFLAVLCAIVFSWSTDKASWPLYLQPLEYVMPFLCVVMALLCRFKPVTIIGRIGVLLGEASYSIYLSHILFLAVIRKIVPVAPLYGTFYFAVAFIGSAITGIIIYKLIEMPLTRFVRKITTPQKVAASLSN